jgi:ubiquinone/menaquinone biosynthesis C-methylase UbiE
MATDTAPRTLINPMTVLEAGDIREDMTVADFGCGTLGYYVLPAARAVGRNGTVYAIDIQKSALEAVRGRLEAAGVRNVKLIWGDIERPDGVRVRDASVDLGLLVNNLFLAQDKSVMGKEAFRILKSGAKFVVVDWKPTGSPLGPAAATRVGRDEARHAVESVGFRFLRTFDPGQYHYGLIFEKP